MVKALLAACVLAACQSHGEAPTPAPGSGSAIARADAGPTPDGELADEGSAHGRPEDPEPVDVGKAIAELGAISAWQAVVDRGQYLARRRQHGVVFGMLGPAILVPGPPPVPSPDAGAAKLDAGLVPSPYVWLVDDTEGNGALAIRVALGAKAASMKEGDRVALGGAWALDPDRRWYWQVDASSPLPPAPASGLEEPPVTPGHVVATGALPPGTHTISLAKDGDAVYFTVVGSPAAEGDGWPIADALGSPVSALLNLPGERPSYGAQDLRTADERWQLRRGQSYWLRIGHLHKHGADKPMTVNARTAPVRVQ